MKKLVFLLIVFLSFLSPLAAEIYFSTYPAAYNVNLEDTDSYIGTDNGEFDNSKPGYNENTLVAQVGFRNTTQPVTVEIKFNQSDWMYQSASQPTLQRPFGLDMVVRQRWYRGNETINCSNGVLHQTDETVTVEHYGFQLNGDSSQTITYTFNPRTNGDVTTKGWNLPGTHTGCFGLDHWLIGAWVEFVLVLPEIDPNDTRYTVGSANDYYASFDITVSGGASASGSWHCEFTGYYDDPHSGDSSFILNVVPTAAASSINLSESTPKYPDENGISVGHYWYSTTRESSVTDSNYYAFVSSSENPSGSEEKKFSLVHQGTDGGEGNEIAFEIGLASEDSSKGIKWFDGITNMNSGTDAFYSSRTENMTDLDGATIFQRGDRGDILFRLASDGDTDGLQEGIYSSYIYFHVVSGQ